MRPSNVDEMIWLARASNCTAAEAASAVSSREPRRGVKIPESFLISDQASLPPRAMRRPAAAGMTLRTPHRLGVAKCEQQPVGVARHQGHVQVSVITMAKKTPIK